MICNGQAWLFYSKRWVDIPFADIDTISIFVIQNIIDIESFTASFFGLLMAIKKYMTHIFLIASKVLDDIIVIP